MALSSSTNGTNGPLWNPLRLRQVDRLERELAEAREREQSLLLGNMELSDQVQVWQRAFEQWRAYALQLLVQLAGELGRPVPPTVPLDQAQTGKLTRPPRQGVWRPHRETRG